MWQTNPDFQDGDNIQCVFASWEVGRAISGYARQFAANMQIDREFRKEQIAQQYCSTVQGGPVS
eukprot:scaffold49123_cov13-Tisochrysis_lutea.AAC.1